MVSFSKKLSLFVILSMLTFCPCFGVHGVELSNEGPPIRLYWQKCGQSGYENFGDELSAKIISKVFGKRVTWASVNDCQMISCGSIIEHIDKEKIKDKIVWTSGFGLEGASRIGVSDKIVGVRGKMSESRIDKRKGQSLTLGDLGLLSSYLLDGKKIEKKYRIGIIASSTELKDNISKNKFFESKDVKVINPLDECEDVVMQIAECDAILSSNLYGLIVADSLHIPNCYFRTSDSQNGEKMYEYYDYYSIYSKDRLRVICLDILDPKLEAEKLKSTVLSEYVDCDAEVDIAKRNLIDSFQRVNYYLDIDNKKSIIETGTYEIVSALASDKVLDVPCSSRDNKAKLQLYKENNTSAQKFNIVRSSDGYYTIQAVCSGRMLDVPGSSKVAGTEIWQYGSNDTDAQKWGILKNDDGTYSIISKCNGLYIDVDRSKTANGTKIQCYDGNGTCAQKFKLRRIKHAVVENGTYELISSLDYNKVFDIPCSSRENKAKLQLYTRNFTEAQRFNIVYGEDGYYTVLAVCSGKMLDVPGSSKEVGTAIWQYGRNNTDAQKWSIFKNEDDTYSIISKCNSLYMDVDGSKTADGTQIQCYDGNGTRAQRFRLKNLMARNSPLVRFTKISPNRSSPRNHVIDTITIHCVVGQSSVQSLGWHFASPSLEASSNYGIGYDGEVGMYVEERDRSWCSSDADNDNRAITIECASDTTHPYAINDRVYKTLIELCADICKRNGIKELKWRADRSLIGKVDKQNMTVHRWFANKSCPGDYIYSRLGQIAREVNSRLGE